MFGKPKETKEEKQERKTRELLIKYGVEDLTDPRDHASVKEIANALLGNKMIETGTILSGTAVDSATLTYYRAMVAQNFMIIRQLDKLNRFFSTLTEAEQKN